jgi:hypothetical protein
VSLHPSAPEPMRVEQRLLRRGGPHDAPTECEDRTQFPRDGALAPGLAELIQTQVPVLVLVQLRLEPRATRRNGDRHCRRLGRMGRRGAGDQTYPQASQRGSTVSTLSVASRTRSDAQLGTQTRESEAAVAEFGAGASGVTGCLGAARCCCTVGTDRPLELLVYRPMQPKGRSQFRVVVWRLAQLRD